ncbi:TM2 domain-containing protein DDB_G0277895-like [Mya arenaria]|uniref:TM2 domain-containing protein DDB_G0277895-like n=1 Tax=Mya arenaria TaxID=6604 RepID=UPI0022E1A652|nr:TM2 domain-containing protein DDB_G0277895-like [Mya arenaria]
MGHGDGVGEGAGNARGKTKRIAVPAMPMPIAVICCILNFLVPGFGTMLAGFSVCCCSRNEDMDCCSKFGSCMMSVGIGLLQLITTALLLLGWIWSCFWGVFFLGMSSEYYHDNPPGGGTVIHQQGQTQAIVVQPGSANYPQGYPVAPQQPQGYQPSPGGQFPTGQSYPHQQYGPQPGGYQGYNQGTPQGPPGGYGEPPPAYTERDTLPSAPPLEK